MKFFVRTFAIAALALVGACTTPAPTMPVAQTRPVEQKTPVTILVSIDGFRADYLDRGITPTLSALTGNGVRGPMMPSFPSKTFPNHWTLVTGKVPDHNGIVANKMEDPRRPGEVFTMASDDPFWWNEAEPIWVAAEKAGVRTATMFWPGSNVGWGGALVPHGWGAVEGGTRPADWQQFNQQIDNTQRVNAVLDWVRRPSNIRPQFVTLYFDTVDTAGHQSGPDGAAVNEAIADVDRHIGDLVRGLKTLHQPANLVIVSDHGMAATSSERVIALDTIADPSLYRIVESGPFAALQPTDGNEVALEKALVGKHGHMECWRKEEIPARLQYGSNPRVPPVFCLADIGWLILPKATTGEFTGGTHGYDNQAPEMRALFIANGPAFRRGITLTPFANVDIAPLLRHLLGLPDITDLGGEIDPLKPALQN
ncbi:alkaline phosphatase family protein [Tsuneonella flava]|uniref:Alkaline phosphatase family protein n=1 Tax=Tsuneonella flava TaxID=2055955 RepID=A0ABX7K9R1_9SPHN|nr:ectonucleotide pyrophosphatase/phosphodiesterase [Tsuneonella flava]QSB43994.1 alkaline phosphatase family protein [Tsuneonella flava]